MNLIKKARKAGVPFSMGDIRPIIALAEKFTRAIDAMCAAGLQAEKEALDAERAARQTDKAQQQLARRARIDAPRFEG